jgi:hypothetical protein
MIKCKMETPFDGVGVGKIDVRVHETHVVMMVGDCFMQFSSETDRGNPLSGEQVARMIAGALSAKIGRKYADELTEEEVRSLYFETSW